MRWTALLLVMVCLAGGEPLVRGGVSVAASVEQDAGGPVIVARFQPAAQDPPLHLYGIDLPAGGAGVATRLELDADAPVQVRGVLMADQPVHDLGGLPVYPEGQAVTLRLPVTAPPGEGAVAVAVRVSYMACSRSSCLMPVLRARLEVAIPGSGRAAPAAAGPTLAQVQEAVRSEVAAAEARILAAQRREAEEARLGGIRWARPADRAAAEALIREAHAAGRAALLDFTGPSCVNCQLMAKTVLRLPEVVRAWNAQAPIEIDTDPPHDDLAAWQQERFGTQARPLYVRIAADGSEQRWDRVFAPSDRETLERFLAFVRDGGGGMAAGTGTGWGEFLLLAVLGGLFTLVMPCTYPMIPFTLNVFAKQAASGARLAPLAAFYALGIVACFIGVGVAVTGVFGASLATLAGHPVTNLLIAALFLVLGLSLVGAFFLRPPAWLAGAAGGARAGYLGAVLMGLTFAVTAFTCTAPFAGAVLAAGVAHGAWGAAVLGMAVYSSTVALPFFLLALAPGLLRRLPRAGGWMNEIKVVGGLVEIAAAFKFLAICDYAWGWGLIGRSLTLALWSAVAAALAAYLMGWWRHDGDDAVERVGSGRLLLAIACAALALWLLSGLCGNRLGLVESFFPGDL